MMIAIYNDDAYDDDDYDDGDSQGCISMKECVRPSVRP